MILVVGVLLALKSAAGYGMNRLRAVRGAVSEVAASAANLPRGGSLGAKLKAKSQKPNASGTFGRPSSPQSTQQPVKAYGPGRTGAGWSCSSPSQNLTRASKSLRQVVKRARIRGLGPQVCNLMSSGPQMTVEYGPDKEDLDPNTKVTNLKVQNFNL